LGIYKDLRSTQIEQKRLQAHYLVYQTPKDKAEIWQKLYNFVEELAIKQLRDLYGLNPNIPHLVFQFPRLPPGLSHPMFKLYENPMKEKFANDVNSINRKIQGFQHMYQQYATGLMNMNSSGIVPPGHPLFNRNNSIEMLKTEKDKLLKENLELKKKLDKAKSN